MDQPYQLLPPLSPQERAAILEVNGGLVRDEAERQAFARLAYR